MSSLTESANFSNHNDSLRLSRAERWRDGEMERGAEMADGSQNIRDKTAVSRLVCVLCVCVCVCVCACVCVCGCRTGRKPNQPVQFAHLIRSLRERGRERDKEREREPSEEQM